MYSLSLSLPYLLYNACTNPRRRVSDTTHLDKQMTKETTNTSQLSQSSQHPRQGPTKLQKDLSRRRTGHRPEHQMLFLLVFLKDKFI